MPVLLTYPIIGPVGQTGEILVSATSEEIIAFTPLNEMISAAAELYLQHCDAIESAFRNMPRTAPLTAFEAQAAANLFLSDNLPDRFCADDPTLDNTANVWRVPVILAYPFIGSIGQVGEICVSTSSEQIISYTPLEEMRAAATPLIEQHRDAIEAPVP
ncbi:MAG TPA: hypothetical protein PKA34_06775 [Blastocatellia bacterium]|nr:hypothetical protein [Blastocatellia bacterium]